MRHHDIKQDCHFGSLFLFWLGCQTISRRAVRRLIFLHTKQNIEIELKCQTCFDTVSSKFSWSSLKGLKLALKLVYLMHRLLEPQRKTWWNIIMAPFCTRHGVCVDSCTTLQGPVLYSRAVERLALRTLMRFYIFITFLLRFSY